MFIHASQNMSRSMARPIHIGWKWSQVFSLSSQKRGFFGKGWDNAALEVTYRGILRRSHIAKELTKWIVTMLDSRTLEIVKTKGFISEKKKVPMGIFLPPHLGDPHRLLKGYSLTAYPILNETGQQSCIQVEEREVPLFADPDDEYSKVVLPNLELMKMLAEELLKTLNWEVSPRGAASFLEALYRGSEIPDAVFETPKVLDSLDKMKKHYELQVKDK